MLIKMSKNFIFSILILIGTVLNAQTKAPVKKQAKSSVTTSTVQIPDRQASYKGGNAALEKYIIDNLKYPAKLDQDTSIVSRKLFLKFKIEPSGKVSFVEVVKPIKGCRECTDEALRVMNMMPDWEPAIENNQPVESWYNLPVTFTKK